MLVENISDIINFFDLDDFTDDPSDLEKAKTLEKAIKKGMISIDEDDEKLLVDLGERFEVKLANGEQTHILSFREATGEERIILQNAGEEKRGEATAKCMSRMCNISFSSYKSLPSRKVAILEGVFSLFL